MKNLGLLVIGVATVSATVGYMFGGSATPVVSVAVPAVFGLAITALALMQGTLPSKEYTELLKTLGDSAGKTSETRSIAKECARRPRALGSRSSHFHSHAWPGAWSAPHVSYRRNPRQGAASGSLSVEVRHDTAAHHGYGG